MTLRNILLILGFVALLAGIALAVIWARLPAERPAENAAAQRSAILVATVDIPQGEQLRSDQFGWKEIPATEIGPTNIARGQEPSEAYVGAVARRTIAAGEPLDRNALVLAGERNFLAGALMPGMYAIALSVEPSQIVAGLVRPGDHVDVLLSESLGEQGGLAAAVDGTVLRDIRVVAVDQWFAGPAPVGARAAPMAPAASKIPKTVTLEVTEGDAKRLLVATQIGRVTLALRSLEGSYVVSDAMIEGTRPVWSDEVSSAFRATRGSSVAQAGGVVRVIRGSKGGG